MVFTHFSEAELENLMLKVFNKAVQPLLDKRTPSEIKYLDVKQAAKYLNISVPTVYKYMRPDASHRLKYSKAGKKVLFSIQDLDDWVESSKCEH